MNNKISKYIAKLTGERRETSGRTSPEEMALGVGVTVLECRALREESA